MRTSARALLSLILVGLVTSLMASNAAIGLAVASGDFQVNAKQARGTATLFDGTTVETGKAASQIRLDNGAELRLATDSRAKVYQDRIVLEKGTGQLESSAAFPLESRTLRIVSTQPNTVARVLVADQGKVLVSTLRGAVRVTNSAGLAVANVTSGLSMVFQPQAAVAATTLSGCLYERESKEFIFDAATRTQHGLGGLDLSKETGKNVELTGTEDPAAKVFHVTAWKQLPGGRCAKFASVAKESGVEAAVKSVGVAGGAAAAGAAAGAGGLAASGGLSPTSR